MGEQGTKKSARATRRTQAERGAAAARKIGPRLRLKVLKLAEDRVDASNLAEERLQAHHRSVAWIEHHEYNGEAELKKLERHVLSTKEYTQLSALVLTNFEVKALLTETEDRWGQRRQGENLLALGGMQPVLFKLEGKGDGWPDAAPDADDSQPARGNGTAH